MNKALFIANGVVEDRTGVSGGEVRFIEVAKGWGRLGNEIHLLSNPSGKEVCNSLDLDVFLHKNKSVSIKSRLNFVVKFLFSLAIPNSLKDFEGPYIYSVNEQLYDVLPGLVLKVRDKKLKWGVVVHWLPPWKWWTREESTFFNSLLFLVSERISLYIAGLFADVLFAVSESTKSQIEKDIIGRFFKKKIRVVKCGVDLEYIQRIAKKNTKKEYDAMFMKRIQAVKGIFDLVKIWNKVVEKKPDAKLLIVGSGPDEQAAKDLSKKLGIERNINFFGPILDMEKKFEMMVSSRIFLLPTYEENWAIVIGEALACGVPVVCYDLKELRQVWEDSVEYIPLKSTQEFSEVVLNMLEDKKRLKKRSQEGIDYIERYSWDTIASDELEFLKK